ncbi:hypothetical protein, partial [Helicobacter ganmani]|uniref:hypothetical protein n=1 Tax=Helicobacter ganmani TaxID=60246 RepID=UPI003A870D06
CFPRPHLKIYNLAKLSLYNGIQKLNMRFYNYQIASSAPPKNEKRNSFNLSLLYQLFNKDSL